MPGSPINVREPFDLARGKLLVRGESFPMGHPFYQTIFDRIGNCVEELLLQAQVINSFLTSISSREHCSFSPHVLVNAAGNERVAELVEVDQILDVLRAIG
jgi:hypothetical protein